MKLVRGSVMAAALTLFSTTGAFAAQPETTATADKPAMQAVVLSRVHSLVSPGQRFGSVKVGILCLPVGAATVTSLDAAALERIRKAFYETVIQAGFKTPDDASSLFETQAGSSPYVVGAQIESESADLCLPYADFNNRTSVVGRFGYKIEWQIYSMQQKRVVARVETAAEQEQHKTSEGSVEDLKIRAFAANVRAFLASPEFKSTYLTPPKSSGDSATPASLPVIYFTNANNGASAVPDSTGQVVTVSTDAGMGSAFLISTEGLMLTNHHVVGDSKFIKVRWADGFETVGEVLRSDAKRDVALIKTDSRGRLPLRLAASTPPPGEDVYAVGTPIDQAFQNTVTRGVVSANRVIDGLSFIQSDVQVTHGNSGGPLMDKTAAIVGMTDLGIQPDGVPIGLNLFIPIRDVLDFLSLKPGTAPQAAKP